MSISDLRDRDAAAVAQEGVEVDPYDAIHIVGRWQDLLGRILRLKVPRALCGELLDEDPDRPGLTEDSPECRRCAELHGSQPTKMVGEYHVLFEK